MSEETNVYSHAQASGYDRLVAHDTKPQGVTRHQLVRVLVVLCELKIDSRRSAIAT